MPRLRGLSLRIKLAKPLSVIIPTLNEEANICSTLSALGEQVEKIVSDGGSSDRTVELAKKAGAKVVSSEPGRAKQMNSGAREASSENLLFLHADTLVPKDYLDQILNTVDQKGVSALAFRLKFEPRTPLLALIETLANFRAQTFSLPFGDQGFVVKREVFQKLEGFKELKLLEDVDFVKRATNQGKIAILSSSVTTSSRRWQKRGVIRTSLRNQLILLLYKLGVSPASLARLYR